MTQERYLLMCEQLGKEPDPKEMPPDLSDFPDIVADAVEVFSYLGDRVFPDIGFIGKDYTALPFYIKNCDVDSDNLGLFLEIISYLESRAIKQSQDAMKREREKLKRKR